MTFNDDSRGSYLYMDLVEQLDYYFIAGDSLDEIIAGYRKLTGKAVMLPKWAFGYVQSKESYRNQDELIDIAAEYRKRGVGIDGIVQDWLTWKEGKWGNKKVDKTRYPDLKVMNSKLHDLHVHSMFSGGFDSWWRDSTEPFSGPDWNGEFLREPWERYKIVGEEHKKFLRADRANLYAAAHAKGMFENQRLPNPNKRVLNLTCSGYASSQKYGTMLWSGDTCATWGNFKKQIVEGLNMCMSGMPYWTLDIGAFFTVNECWQKRGCGCNQDESPKWFGRGDYEDGVADYGYHELYVRWFQYGAFLPMFRSHGKDTPREIWNFGEKGDMFYDALEETIRLRYRLMPYIYSMAGNVYLEDYTMLRSLLLDFPDDQVAASLDDEFMFGESLLVCPITEPMHYDKKSKKIDIKETKKCYLPTGADWIDYYSGEQKDGGQWVEISATLKHIPLFIKAGSIIPMEQGLTYASEEVEKPLEIYIYSGKDARFDLYEDAGDDYGYEDGIYNQIELLWNDNERKLTIGDASYDFAQSICHRSCKIVLNEEERIITYIGEKMEICF